MWIFYYCSSKLHKMGSSNLNWIWSLQFDEVSDCFAVWLELIHDLPIGNESTAPFVLILIDDHKSKESVSPCSSFEFTLSISWLRFPDRNSFLLFPPLLHPQHNSHECGLGHGITIKLIGTYFNIIVMFILNHHNTNDQPIFYLLDHGSNSSTISQQGSTHI